MCTSKLYVIHKNKLFIKIVDIILFLYFFIALIFSIGSSLYLHTIFYSSCSGLMSDPLLWINVYIFWYLAKLFTLLVFRLIKCSIDIGDCCNIILLFLIVSLISVNFPIILTIIINANNDCADFKNIQIITDTGLLFSWIDTLITILLMLTAQIFWIPNFLLWSYENEYSLCSCIKC